MDEMSPSALATSPNYQFKPGRYSSHSLLLGELPSDGQGLRVLDVGCAGGYLSDLLSARGFSVTAIDTPGTEPPACAEFLPADLDRGLPALHGSFDYIICADVLEHLRRPLSLLRELHATLAPEGQLLLSLPNSGNIYFRWNVLLGRFPQHDRGLFDRTHLHFYTWDGWVHLLERSGFRIERQVSSSVPFGVAFPRMERTLAVRLLERASYESARVWKGLLAYQFIVKARAI
jgi:SAM-dependent methyltransferase